MTAMMVVDGKQKQAEKDVFGEGRWDGCQKYEWATGMDSMCDEISRAEHTVWLMAGPATSRESLQTSIATSLEA